MRKNRFTIKKFFAAVLAATLVIGSVEIPSFTMESYASSGTVNTDRLNLRSGPGTSYRAVAVLSTNARVEIIGSTQGTDGYTWYQVSLSNGTTGYLRSDFVKQDVIYSASDGDFEAYLNAQGFPESYKNALRGLHEKYPNWVFKAQHTGLDWNEAVAQESKIGRNLVETDSISSWKSTADGAFDWAGNYWPGFDGVNWVAASEGIIKHYMDPRNFLTDPYIFQFELQSYDRNAQTKEGLAAMVQDTFLSGAAVSQGSGYSGNGSATGPGMNKSSSGSNVIGPSSYSQNSGSQGSVTGPAAGSAGAGTAPAGASNNNSNTSVGPDLNAVLVAPGVVSNISSLLGVINAYADWQVQNDKWVYVNDDGSLKKSGWYWLDGNKDGIAECYYFYEDGTLAVSTEAAGYLVDANGAWVENGKVQRKNTSTGELITSQQNNVSANSSVNTVSQNSVSTDTGSQTTYVDLIMKAAEQSGVSPYVLAAMIIQEQGKKGTSPLISGTYSQYPGVYNFYNIAAYEHDGMTAVQAGLKYASESGNAQRPWNTIEKGIVGGAIAYGANYTDNGQDTFYLKKFNVQGSNKYNHQFMTNVVAAAQEGAKVGNAYPAAIKGSALVFKIPVYQNMPEVPCELPQGTGSPNNKLYGLGVDGFSITPTFNMNTTEYSLIVDTSVSNINISAQTIDSSAKVQGTGNIGLSQGNNDIVIAVTAGNGSVRNYVIHVTKKDGGATYQGGMGMTYTPNNGGAYGPASMSAGNTSGTATGPAAASASGSQTGPSLGGSETTQVPAENTQQSAQNNGPAVVIGGPPM